MGLANFIRGLVKAHPEIKTKLKKANSKLSPFQYMYQTVSMTLFSIVFLGIIIYLGTKSNLLFFIVGIGSLIFLIPLFYKFWLSYVDVLIRKYGRELDGDILFVSEYFLVSLESGLPIGNAIENISRLDRPGGRFFKRVFTEFKTGKSFEDALNEGANIAPCDSMKMLIKRLKDSMSIGVDLRTVLENFILESSEKKLLEIKAFSKKLNPIVMMYLLMGIVLPSLGITFFILAAAMLDITPDLLKYVLIFVFLIMFVFQYFAYSTFKFSKSTI